MRRAWLSFALAAAVAALAGSVALTIGRTGTGRHTGMMTGTSIAGGYGTGMMDGANPGTGGGLTGSSAMLNGTGMMNGAAMMGSVWLAGDGTRITSIAAARARAASAAAAAGLHPGEVIWFDNGFYAELEDASGAPATEIIVDPATGTVTTEPGPAMMWNTRYGMHRTTAGTSRTAVSAARARQIATAWLSVNLSGRRVDAPDAYPGYYTLETTTAAGTINGMLSVNAATGQVWYHSWHGRFIAREDS